MRSSQINIFIFKQITPDDLPLLYEWFRQPHVQRWWPVPEKDEWFDKFLKRIRSKDTFAYLGILSGTPMGYIQYYYIDRTNEKAGSWLPELPVNTVGTDQFIGESTYLGKGYGTRLVKDFIDYLTSTLEPKVTTIIVDPDPRNSIAIRCYEKVGFQNVGTYTTSHGSHLLMRYDVKPCSGENSR